MLPKSKSSFIIRTLLPALHNRSMVKISVANSTGPPRKLNSPNWPLGGWVDINRAEQTDLTVAKKS